MHKELHLHFSFFNGPLKKLWIPFRNPYTKIWETFILKFWDSFICKRCVSGIIDGDFHFCNSSLINCLMQQTEMSAVMNSILENQAELMKEVKSLRQENQQLRQMLWWVWISSATNFFGRVPLSYLVGSFCFFYKLTIGVWPAVSILIASLSF